MVLAQAGDGLDNTEPVLKALGIGYDERPAWTDRPQRRNPPSHRLPKLAFLRDRAHNRHAIGRGSGLDFRPVLSRGWCGGRLRRGGCGRPLRNQRHPVRRRDDEPETFGDQVGVERHKRWVDGGHGLQAGREVVVRHAPAVPFCRQHAEQGSQGKIRLTFPHSAQGGEGAVNAGWVKHDT